MEEKKKITISVGKFVTLIIVLLLIVIVSVVVIYQQEKKVNDETELSSQLEGLSEEKKEAVSFNIKGVYQSEISLTEDRSAFYKLSLFENGTFIYNHSITIANSSMGYYSIDGNTIILHEQFLMGGDIASFEVTGRDIKLTINNDGSISDKNELIEDSINEKGKTIDLSNIKLKKESHANLDESEVINQLKAYKNYINELEKSSSNNIKEEFTNIDIKGVYKTEIKITEDKDKDAFYELNLYENGTFIYDHSITNANSSIGYYSIDGNTIILHEQFLIGGDIGSVEVTGRDIKLTINNDGSISDKNKLIEDTINEKNKTVDLSNIRLIKEQNAKLDEDKAIKDLKAHIDFFKELNS